MDNCIHRMMVGGPRDNHIVWVPQNMPEFQIEMQETMHTIETFADIVAADNMVVDLGYYYADEYHDSYALGILTTSHYYFRWQGVSRTTAAKIYMRRAGKSLYEIYNLVEWDSWLE